MSVGGERAASPADDAVLDNPVWSALAGPHAERAEAKGRAARYPSEVSPFGALEDPRDPSAWSDLAALAGPGGTVALFATAEPPPEDWEVLGHGPAVQLVEQAVEVAPDPEARVLTPDDVPDMLDLVARTQPGPFLPRTIELGTYLGIRRDGELVAMAGERLHLPGWTEISAVCTAESARGQGLGSRLVRAVAAGIRARGERAVLHAAGTNTSAIRLYEALGFTVRLRPTFYLLRAPAPAGGPAEPIPLPRWLLEP